MRAISLWQPWATALAVGVKTIETRSYPTNVRGTIAIHAARRWTAAQIMFAWHEHQAGRLPQEIRLGVIVAIAELYDCRCSEELAPTISDTEARFGDFSDGRYGWLLRGVRPLQTPIPYKGKQGFFHLPDDVLAGAIFEEEL